MVSSRWICVMAIVTLVIAERANAQGEDIEQFTTLHEALHLRPEQEQTWQYFKRATETRGDEDERHRRAYERMDNLHAPERMDLSIELMRSDLERLERRAAAMKTFYSVLSSNQKDIFDKITLPPR